MKGLTDKQRKVFEFISSQIVKTNRPPTMREISTEFGMRSTGSAMDVIRALVKKSYIEKDPNISRGIRIKKSPGPLSGKIVELPVVGEIVPGVPIGAFESVKETLKLDKSMVPDGEIFAVKAKDKSMVEAAINEGDYAFIRRQATCRPKQIVAVLLKGKITLREFSKQGNIIYLLPKSQKFKPIRLDLERFKTAIVGVLVGVYRRY